MKTKAAVAKSANLLITMTILFVLTAFGLLCFVDDIFNYEPLIYGGLLAFLIFAAYGLMILSFNSFDRLLYVVVAMLLSVGMVMQFRLNPDSAVRQLIMLFAGFVLMFGCMIFIRFPDKIRKLTMLLMLGSIGILAALLVVGSESGGAKNWISIAGFVFQPSEFIKLVLAFTLAHYFDRYTSVKANWRALAFAALCTIILVAERDLGAALLFALTTLTVFFAATGRRLFTLAGLGVGMLGAFASYHLFDHVKQRVEVWRNPWATYDKSGYQIAQGLMAIASGGLFGMGLGLGSPKSIPAYHTDYIFAVICEELGVLVGLCVIAFYIIFIIRGLIIAMNAPTRFFMLLALGCTVLITLQSFIIIGGVIKLIPLTGITLPFVSHGGSSIISCMMNFGILQGIAALSGNAEATK